MVRYMIDNRNDVVLKLCENSLRCVVTLCLTKDENGRIDHSKCSGYYQDNYGFGYTMRCLCGCHKETGGEVTK
jgi:hypothetical protein